MFEVILSSKAKKDLKLIKRTKNFKRVRIGLLELKDNPLFGDVKSLKAFPFADYRKRIGPYRILFDIDLDEKLVKVYRIRHRKEVYGK